MSNYGNMPPPGPYVPPAQSTPAQGYNAQQTSQYQSGAVNQNQSNHAHKMPGGALGQMMNQAVTTGKPMLDKLGKTISSRFGNKPAPGPPQHLQSYQNYQSHQGQSNPQAYQQHNQTQSPAPQQQQWQQPAHSPAQPQPPNAYSSTPQQTPFQQSTYATPASGHSGQNNYFPQTAPTPSPQATHTPQNAPSPVYNAQYGQSGGGGLSQQMQQQHGQYGHTQEQYQQQQEQQHNNFAGQQMGVVGNTQNQGYSQGTQPAYSQDNQAPHMANTASKVSAQPPAQSQWGYPPEKQGQLGGLQQTTGSTQPVPQPQWRLPHEQQGQMTGVQHSSHTSPVQQDQQQWNSMSPVSAPGHVSPLASPSPQTVDVQPQIPVNKPIISQPSNSVPQKAAPTEFVAELPGDFENLKLADAPQEQTSPAQTSQYQPYHPPSAQPGSPTNRFSVSRRAVSTSSLPLADPWRFADPITEQPTREFYIIADLLYEALDRKIEPQHTGLLEAPKILKSWVELSDDAQRLFSYNNYAAFASLWSLEGIPHLMVPVQPNLAPIWNFSQQTNSQDVKVISEAPSANATYATYIPALNRAGWYKFFFLEMMQGPSNIGQLLSTLCPDTYKPGVLNHPDLSKRDRAEIPALQARAAEIQAVAIKRVCDETRAAMSRDTSHSVPTSQPPYPH